jgi:hypothetical protein
VTAVYEGEKSQDVLQQVERTMDSSALPPGYSWSFGRQFEQAREQQNDMRVNVLLAQACVYFVMAALVESLLHPLVIMLCVPFAGVGVVWTLALTRTPLNILALIGLVILIGAVVNNGIVLLDHVNTFRRRGASLHEAIVAGARELCRPILMTASTTVLGLLPFAVGDTLVEGAVERARDQLDGGGEERGHAARTYRQRGTAEGHHGESWRRRPRKAGACSAFVSACCESRGGSSCMAAARPSSSDPAPLSSGLRSCPNSAGCTTSARKSRPHPQHRHPIETGVVNNVGSCLVHLGFAAAMVDSPLTLRHGVCSIGRGERLRNHPRLRYFGNTSVSCTRKPHFLGPSSGASAQYFGPTASWNICGPILSICPTRPITGTDHCSCSQS